MANRVFEVNAKDEGAFWTTARTPGMNTGSEFRADNSQQNGKQFVLRAICFCLYPAKNAYPRLACVM